MNVDKRIYIDICASVHVCMQKCMYYVRMSNMWKLYVAPLKDISLKGDLYKILRKPCQRDLEQLNRSDLA